MFKNKKILIALGSSFFASVLFAWAATQKANVTTIDLYLGTIWVLILSLIISFSLIHHVSGDGTPESKKGRHNHTS